MGDTMRTTREPLILKLTGTPSESGKVDIQIEKSDEKFKHLLPFSCISLIGSQLTVLTSHHPRSLTKRLLNFAETPVVQFESINYISSFQLEIYEGGGRVLYNIFNPKFTRSPSTIDNDRLEIDIENLLMNYVATVFDGASNSDKSNLQIFVLMASAFYRQNIASIMRRMNMHDLEQRKKLAKTVMDFSTTLYRSWDSPKSLIPGSASFIEKVNQARQS